MRWDSPTEKCDMDATGKVLDKYAPGGAAAFMPPVPD